MSVYALKDRTVRMYVYKNVEDYVLKGKSTSTVSDFVGKFLPSISNQQQIKTLLTNNSDIVTLSAVQKVEISYKAGIAVEQGLSVSFIQPWYIEPATIKLSGNSYLGCYPDISPSDTDVEEIYDFFNKRLGPTVTVQRITKDISRETSATGRNEISVGDKKEIVLEIINNPKKTDRFIGYITSFNFSENIDKPYLLDYDIEFVGKPDSRRIQEEANKTSREDLQKVARIR